MKSFFNFLKQHYIWSVVILIVVIVLGKLLLGSSGNNLDTITLAPQEFIRTVAVAGKVKPADDVELGFESTGRIVAVYKKEGDRTYTGETLAVISSGDASSNVMKAQADLDAELARLSELQNNVGGSGTSVLTSQRELVEAISDAYTRSDNSIRNSVDQVYKDGSIVFAFDDNDLRIELDKKRGDIETLLRKWNQSIDLMNTENITQVNIDLAETNLNIIKSFLERVSLAVNDFKTVGSDYSQTEIDKFKSDISSARTSINLAISNIISAKESVRDTKSEIPYQEAKVKSAQATLNSYRSELAKRSITAPFNGVVTKQDAKVGEIVGANSVVMRLISNAKFTIETYVPEINISEVQVGNLAKVTLDAYGDDQEFQAKIVSVDTGETIKDGVSTYKVLFEFVSEDDRLKSGMTANVIITTEAKQGALLIPQEAIVKRNGFSYVNVLVGKETIEKQITIGSAASNGLVEVVAGLSEGEVVIKNVK